MPSSVITLYSGAAAGAEADFGRWAERYALAEVNFTFAGHEPVRDRGLRHLTPEELAESDAALALIGRVMNRQFPENDVFRCLLMSIWHQVHHGEAVYVVGRIQGDGTVTGGTGWGAEYAKQCNKPLFVFDQERDAWYRWRTQDWEAHVPPVITQASFTGTGTRFLEENGRAAIAGLFERSFGPAPTAFGASGQTGPGGPPLTRVPTRPPPSLGG